MTRTRTSKTGNASVVVRASETISAEEAERLRLLAMSEVVWQKTVLDHAQRAGWLRYYIPDGMWRRAFKKNANGKQYGQKLGDKGFPDLVLLRAGRLIFRELKKMGGTLQPEQEVWRDELLNAGADWKLWRPSDLDDVIADLWEGRAQ